MSEATVELVRQGVAAINSTYESADIDPWRQHVERAFDPEVVLESGAAVFTEGEWHGHEGAVANQMEVLEGMWLRADELIDVDDDCLFAAISFGGRARHTGIPVELHPFHVFKLRDGRILRWHVFQDRDAALEAAGLRE
jgi:ketosteroid isomerase-like protein